jgi:hypothetical protein
LDEEMKTRLRNVFRIAPSAGDAHSCSAHGRPKPIGHPTDDAAWITFVNEEYQTFFTNRVYSLDKTFEASRENVSAILIARTGGSGLILEK